MSKQDAKIEFTSLYHLLNKELLFMCHKELDKNKAVGIDGVNKAMYEEKLDENLKNLVSRLKNKAYKPQASLRIQIPKDNGKTRPLGIASYEDKLVQLALKKIIEAVYEPRFLECMYGFRPGIGCHDAVKALGKAIEQGKTNWVVEADIRGYFDHVSHEWMMRVLGVHIKDPNILRLVQKFLKAGIMENGVYKDTEEGTAQGSNLSPVISNVYMHYMLALWFYKTVKPSCMGSSSITIYADDFVCCFQRKSDAEKFYILLQERLKMFGLELEMSKTRLIEFGKYAEENRKEKGLGKPETFDFLGFTHYCSRSRGGWYRVKRKTSKKKFKAKIKSFKQWIIHNRVLKIKEIMKKVNEKLRGHYHYYGITDNTKMLRKYYNEVEKLLYKWLNRRSQRNSYNFDKFKQMLQCYPLVKPKIYISVYGD